MFWNETGVGFRVDQYIVRANARSSDVRFSSFSFFRSRINMDILSVLHLSNFTYLCLERRLEIIEFSIFHLQESQFHSFSVTLSQLSFAYAKIIKRRIEKRKKIATFSLLTVQIRFSMFSSQNNPIECSQYLHDSLLQ